MVLHEMTECKNDLWCDIDDELLLTAAESDGKGDADLKEASSKAPRPEDKTSCDTAQPPLLAFRHGYLWVSDLLSQSWCEQQMVYNFTVPVEVVEKPEVTAGSELHLARELEVQDIVRVKVTSDEDIFAVKVLNLLGAVESFLQGIPVRREIPIFGAPFGQDVFMIGMIDEIRCDPVTFDLDLLEFKTRNFNSLPSKPQERTHHLQVMIYKKLFDDLVTGKISQEDIVRHLHLKLDRELGEGVQSQLERQDVDNIVSLGSLLDRLFSRMQSIPCISQMLIEYCYQEDKSTIAVKSVPYDEVTFKEKFLHYIKYWRGDRKECGVDIEEAWKCQKCTYADMCEWRERKAEEYARKNSKHTQLG